VIAPSTYRGFSMARRRRSDRSAIAEHPWRRFALRTVASFCLGLVLLVVGSFFMIHLVGGDPVRASMGILAPADTVNLRRHELHLDDPLPKQFGLYVFDLVRLRFGVSIPTGRPVSETIDTRLPNTLELAGLAAAFVFAFSTVIGMVTGALTYSGKRRRLEAAFAWLTGILIAVPEFLLATFLVFLFAVTWRFLPVGGKTGLSSFVLPAAALAIAPTAVLARIIRLETVKVLGTDYIRTARSKHLPWRILYVRHALPNLLTSALTIGGLIFAGLIGGSVIIENVFGWPGLGTAVVTAIIGRDFSTVQAIVLLLGLFVLLVNTLVDVILAVVNPRSIIGEL
jgi:peptide/nickel transport system permease protein